MSKQCSKCGAPVGKHTFGAVTPEQMRSMAQSGTRPGYKCPDCNAGFCSSCARQAAKIAQKGGYTCPECHKLIGDYPW